jgi:hypothetical protein
MGSLSKVNSYFYLIISYSISFLFSFTVSRDGLTYLVGICVSPDNSNTAIIQQDKATNRSIVLGKLDDVKLIGEG